MYHKFNDTLGEGDFDRSACVWFAFAILCFTPSYTAGGWAAAREADCRTVDQPRPHLRHLVNQIFR